MNYKLSFGEDKALNYSLMLENAKLGAASNILANVRMPGMFSIGDVVARLLPPIRLSQIGFLTSAQGTPLGFITWAYVTPEVLTAMRQRRPLQLELEQWNEGWNLHIADLVAPNGGARLLIREALKLSLRGHSTISYRSQRRGLVEVPVPLTAYGPRRPSKLYPPQRAFA